MDARARVEGCNDMKAKEIWCGRWLMIVLAVCATIVATYVYWSGRRPITGEAKLNLFQRSLLEATPEGLSVPSRFVSQLTPTVFRIFGNMNLEQRQALTHGRPLRVGDLPQACRREVLRYLQIAGGGRSFTNIEDAVILTQSGVSNERAWWSMRVVLRGEEFPYVIYLQ
jgi:hypothetical protein